MDQQENTERIRNILRNVPSDRRNQIKLTDIDELADAVENDHQGRIERWLTQWTPHRPQSATKDSG